MIAVNHDIQVIPMRPTTIIIALLILAVATSCGVYSFSPGGKSNIKTIAIERFENKTDQLGLTDQLTDGVIDAFIADGNLKVVSIDNADAVLIGTLVSYQRKPYEYTQSDQVTSYAVTMGFEITMQKPDDGSEIWKERIVQEGIYNIDTETEEEGQAKALDLLVDAVINRTTKSW